MSDDDKKDDKKSGEDEADKPKTGKDERRQIRETGITPMEFYKKYVPVDVDDLVTLCNVPMASRPFNKRYRIRYTANVAEAGIRNSSTCRSTCSKRPRSTRLAPDTRSGSPATAPSSRCVRPAISTATACARTSCSAPISDFDKAHGLEITATVRQPCHDHRREP